MFVQPSPIVCGPCVITYDPTMQTLTAEGNVIWQDGETTKAAKYVRILLHNPPKVTEVVL